MGPRVFDVLNRSYKDLYGTTLLSEEEIGFYIRTYLGHVDPEFVKIAVDGDTVWGSSSPCPASPMPSGRPVEGCCPWDSSTY
jgi:hypothetical protein